VQGNTLFLTLVGGGAFGNHPDWITDGIQRTVESYGDYGLDVAIVSYDSSRQSTQKPIT
jgi:hypothetical protein